MGAQDNEQQPDLILDVSNAVGVTSKVTVNEVPIKSSVLFGTLCLAPVADCHPFTERCTVVMLELCNDNAAIIAVDSPELEFKGIEASCTAAPETTDVRM
eukprot:TRINITY_DN11587_c0_g2_i2.p3 TRINITY_DN11587_c0_g2~~TRINITY_DN11587_c0_g2_i2.p3  ORF type:complete len:100 (-),score=28.98 TRINITY_DN11587_c0_g2_i2:259-558(-)